MKIRSRNFKKNKETFNFWPSFADVMATITLVFFLLFLLAFIQSIITSNYLKFSLTELDTSKKTLEDTKKTLIEAQNNLEMKNLEISDADKKLMLLIQDMNKTKAEVEKGILELSLSEKQIEEGKLELIQSEKEAKEWAIRLEELKAEREKILKTLNLMNRELNIQNDIITASNAELGDLRSKLNEVAVLRIDILEKVKNAIEMEIGKITENKDSLVSIGENANIIINESVVFDYNSFNIRDEGKTLLSDMAKAFENVLDDDNVRDNIDTINIEGHTDETGSAEYNMDLSSKRATTVVNYLLTSNPSLEKKYGKYFSAIGYSEFRPLIVPDPLLTRQESIEVGKINRRIEISIKIKDPNVIKMISEYLENSTIIESTTGD